MLEQPDGMTWEEWEVYLLNLGRRRRRRRGVLGSPGGVTLPTAPVLAMDPLWDTTQATPLWVADAAWADQDDLQFEVQVAGGDWSGATVTNHTVITSEIAGTQIDFPSGALANGNYEARCKFKHSGGSYSAYSNIVSFTVAAVAANQRISSAGNNRISSAGNNRIFA